MANTSHRALRLLSLLGSGRQWSLRELATRLGASERTVRRDIETLRRLDYPVATIHGPGGGYRLGTGRTLPPLLFDHDQALAVAVALQTAPSTMFGLGDDTARALATLHQVMPPALRASMESLRLTRLQNYWEFPAPPSTRPPSPPSEPRYATATSLSPRHCVPTAHAPNQVTPTSCPPTASSLTAWSSGPPGGTWSPMTSPITNGECTASTDCTPAPPRSTSPPARFPATTSLTS
jgi:biotin operon repressor